MPSMPSVPLMSARPSFSASATGAIPASASASAAGRARPSASRTGPSPMTASAQCASGARSPEQPSDPYSWTIGRDPGRQQRRVRLGRLAAHAGPPGRERRQAQEHQRAHDLALDLGPRSRRRGCGSGCAAARCAAVGGMCAAGERAEAGRDAVVRAGVLDERVDDARGCARSRRSRPAESATGAPCRATATTSSMAGAPTPTMTGCCASMGGIQRARTRRCHRSRSDSCLTSETVPPMANVPAAAHALDVLTLLGRHVAPVPARPRSRATSACRARRPTTSSASSSTRASSSTCPRSAATASGRPRSSSAPRTPARSRCGGSRRRCSSRLVADTTHNGHFAVLDGRDTLYLIEERAAGRPSLVTEVGVRLPAPLTASGLAMLAALPAPQVRALWPSRQRPRPPPRRRPRLADRAARAARRRAPRPATPSRTARSRPGSPRSRRRSWTTTPTRSPPWRSPSRRTRSTRRRGPRSRAGSSPRPGRSRATSAAARARRPSPRAEPRRQGASRSSAQPSPVRR